MTTGALLMAYGTPLDRDDITRYYTDIRRGRPPSDEQLADLVRRYDAIGGTFPLREITGRQVAAIERGLAEHGDFRVALGTKHSVPTIEDGVRALHAEGVERVVGLVLAPHYSRMSIGEYAERTAKAGAESGLRADTIESWHLLPAYVQFLTAAVARQLRTLPEGSEVVFTAHSLPARIAQTGDVYPEQVWETGQAVAAAAELPKWSTAWQSAGRTPEPWLGPDVLDVLRDRAETGCPGVLVCPCGFVADHLEVAYDLDLEARRLAAEIGIPFARTATPNDDDAVMRALAGLVATRA